MKYRKILAAIILTCTTLMPLHSIMASDGKNIYNLRLGMSKGYNDESAPSLQFEYPDRLKRNFHEEGSTFPTIRAFWGSDQFFAPRGEQKTFGEITGYVMNGGFVYETPSTRSSYPRYQQGIYMQKYFRFVTDGYLVTLSYLEKVSDTHEALPDGTVLSLDTPWEDQVNVDDYYANVDDWYHLLDSMQLVYNDARTGQIDTFDSSGSVPNSPWREYTAQHEGVTATFKYPGAFRSMDTKGVFQRNRPFNSRTDMIVELVDSSDEYTFIDSGENVNTSKKIIDGIAATIYDVNLPRERAHESYVRAIGIPMGNKTLYVLSPSDKYAGGGLSDDEWNQLLTSISIDNPTSNKEDRSKVIHEETQGKRADADLQDKTLIKSSNSPVVYFFQDDTRRPFLDEELFRLWYKDFSSVITLSPEELARIPIGRPVLPPPGTWIKIPSVPKVYEVQEDGKTIRWIRTENAARRIRGAKWNRDIRTVDVTLYSEFTEGATID
jgi:hypothetical protein